MSETTKAERDRLKAALGHGNVMVNGDYAPGPGFFMRLKRDADALEQAEQKLKLALHGVGEGCTRPHDGPEDCPTYYDNCHCSVETLVHNIDRAEKAERELIHVVTEPRLCDVLEALDRIGERLTPLGDHIGARVRRAKGEPK